MLSLLARGDLYGYEIIESTRKISNGDVQWTSNKLYPLLHRMQQDGLLTSYWKPSDDGPDRKYYHLTEKGALELKSKQKDWKRAVEIMTTLWGPDFELAT